MIPLFAFVILFALVVAGAAEASARAANRRAEAGKPGGKALDPARFAAAVKSAVADERDPAKLEAVAKKLDGARQGAAAAAVRERAAEIRSGKATSSSAATAFTPPFPGASAKAWNRYVRLMAAAEPAAVSTGNQLGMFQIGFRRLADLGYVENVRKVQKNGRAVWVGDFKTPLTLSGFLKDPVLQYQVFAKAAKADRSAILARHGGAIGNTIGGKTVTLSGLLAAAYHAGLAGLAHWLSDEEERRRAPRTTAIYERTTGLF